MLLFFREDWLARFRKKSKPVADLDSNVTLRNELLGSFFKQGVKPGCGVIICNIERGGCYVYVLMSKEEAFTQKKVNQNYLATALFQENNFVGFEEAFINDQGVHLMDTGYYVGNMQQGDYISNVIVYLSHLKKCGEMKLVDESINKTNEVIYSAE